MGALHSRERLFGQLGVAIEGRIADAGARAFLVIVGVSLRLARDSRPDVREIRIGILSARNQAVRLLGFGHLLERENVLLLFIDGGGQQFAGLTGGIVQRVIELALDGSGALARAEPGVKAGVGESDRNDGGNNIDADQERAAADGTRGGES